MKLGQNILRGTRSACVVGLYLVWFLEIIFLITTGISANTAAGEVANIASITPGAVPGLGDLAGIAKTYGVDIALLPLLIAAVRALYSLAVTIAITALLALAISNIDIRNMGTFKLHRQLRAEHKSKR